MEKLVARIQRLRHINKEVEKLANKDSNYANELKRKIKAETDIINCLISVSNVVESDRYISGRVDSYIKDINKESDKKIVGDLSFLTLRTKEVVLDPDKYNIICKKIDDSEFILIVSDLKYLSAIQESIKKVNNFKLETNDKATIEIYEHRIKSLKKELEYVCGEFTKFLNNEKTKKILREKGWNNILEDLKQYIEYLAYGTDEEDVENNFKDASKNYKDTIRSNMRKLIYAYYNELSE